MSVAPARIRPATVAGLLRARAAESPGREAYLFLADGEAEGERLTWGDLDRRARAIAFALREPLQPGDRALLLYPPGLDFVAAFFGCLYAGVVAVPAYPPRPHERSLDRLRTITADAEPRAALTTAALLAGIAGKSGGPEPAAVRWIATDALPEVTVEDDLPEPAPGSLAFLQYTSGSTANPKGVMVTHANLLHNEAMIAAAFRQSEDSVVVGWLPLYHDMGLIGNVLQPLHAGGRCVLMAPAAFLQRPRRWLEAISKYCGTTSGGPNFAYELCVRRVPPEQREGLDLRSWRLAFNGAEPVRAETLARFAEAFAPCGFDPAAFYPCYGLAEATLFVSGGEAGMPPRSAPVTGALPLVSCGHAWDGQRIAIADPESGAEQPPGVEGEIWIAGPSVAAGYWRNPETTERDFRAHLLDGEGPFLRTGDLGVLSGDELFVTGRIKDLVILRGRNHYPQDLERTAEAAHAELRPGGAAAFAVEDGGEERLVIVAEVERRRREDLAAIAEAVRRAVAEEHEVQVGEVVLVKPGGVPKTSSGKVRRSACRAAWLAGELPVLEHSAVAAAEVGESEETLDAAGLAALSGEERRGAIERWVRSRAAAALGIPAAAIDPDRPLTSYGLDSLGALELQGSVEAALLLALPLSELLAGAGTARLAEILASAKVPEAASHRSDVTSHPPGVTSHPSDVASHSSDIASHRSDMTPYRSDVASHRSGMTSHSSDVTSHRSGVTSDRYDMLPDEPGARVETPLSFGERALWFLDRLAPAEGAYNIAVAARVHGALDPEALRRAFAALAGRHEALRTVFPWVGEEPVRRVLAEGMVDFVQVEGAEVSPEGLAEEAWRPFDLEAGPLVRVRVRRGVLLLSVHHLVADFTSLAVIGRDLAALYRAEAASLPPAHPASEFVHWQSQMLASPRGEVLWESWQRTLDGVPDLDLPTDRPRPPVQTWRGLSRAAVLPAGETAALRSLAADRGATLFAALLAAFQAQLGRYTGQDDFAVGTPTAGRGAPAWQSTVGYLVNPAALRADLAGNPGFGALVERARRTAVAALETADFPFALLAERLRPARDPARSPIFQVMLALHSRRPGDPPGLAAFALGEDGARIPFADLELKSIGLSERRAQFEISLSAAELPDGGLGLSLEANAGLFDAAAAERMLGHFRTLLAAAVADPERPIDRLPLLTPAEREQVAAEWRESSSAPRAELPARTLQEAFLDVAARSPEAIAVEVEGEEGSLTYRELAARSALLADRLRAMGIGPEIPVALCVERSADLVVGCLGILRAGGVYLPLDPDHSTARLGFVLADAGAAALVTQRGLAARLPADPESVPVPRLFLEELDPHPLTPSPTRTPTRPGEGESISETLAYVIYTSGSTGRPKGVAVSHGAALAHCLTWADIYRLHPGDRVLQFASPGFDASIEQIFATLLAGATLVLRGREPWGAEDLTARLAGLGVTVADLPTALWGRWTAEGGGASAGLRLVGVGGEELRAEAVRLWRATPLSQVPLLNSYGPTEAVISATLYAVPAEGGDGPVPIGRALPGRVARVLDRAGHPQPVGIPGELCLGGVLARGYLGRPELTAERFVPDPFSETPGERLYRSGDRVRRRWDGEIEFLGRFDDQVKVRGFRIEPAEIEAALLSHPEIRDAAVLALGVPGTDDRRLVAFVVPSSSPRALPWAEPERPVGPENADGVSREVAGPKVRAVLAQGNALGEGVRAHLRRLLPDYMIPTSWVTLPALPVNPNGKVDRAALARLAPEVETGGEAGAAAPRTPEEEILAGLFAELLGRERVGIHDDFFTLGGHSLLATRAVARIARVFAAELPVSALFQAPTVAALAERLVAAPDAAPPIQPLEPAADAPLSFAQQRLWFLDRLEPGTAVYNLPGAVDLDGPFAVPALIAALSTLIAHHEILRTVYTMERGEPVQRILPSGEQPLPVIDLIALPAGLRNGEADRLGAEEARAPFDLARGPVCRTHLLRLAPQEHRLLVTFHHIAADGWSLGLFLDELTALLAGRPLPALPVQYADWAAWQRAWMQGEELARQLAWWRVQLTDLPVLELPADHPRPAVRDPRGGSRSLPLRADLEAAVARLARQTGVTAFMVLLGAFQTLLARITGEDTVPVGSPVANRRRAETEPLIGLFVNTLVLTARLCDDPSFTDLLARVREACLGAYAHQDIPFERLVQELRPERDLGQNPLFQAMLVLDEAMPAREVGGTLALTPRRADAGTSRFDLMLAVTPGKGGWTLLTEHAAALFEPVTIDRLLGHFANLLQGATAGPEARISDLPLLTEAERVQLAAWNAPHPPTPSPIPSHPPGEGERSLHGLVAMQAARTPDAEAVVGEEERITYGELMRRADRIAEILRGLGVGPEVRVGLCLRRTPDMIAAILGVLAAGGAYVPLDPGYPQERLDFMLTDSGAGLLWTEQALTDRFAFFQGQTLLAEEVSSSPSPGRGECVWERGLGGEALAYIIYTSGSTGRPKGVGITHRSAVAFVEWALGVFPPEELRGVLAATSICFDLSIFELFVPLAGGGRVILAPSVLELPQLAAIGEVTLVNAVPSPMAELVHGHLPASLRTVNLAGEALLPDLVERIYAHPQVERVVNLYGPSEDTTYSTWTVVPRGAAVTIGRPIAGTQAWVLGRWGEALPVGVIGELCLGGMGLARGYLGRPELTAEKLVPDPFSGREGARLYRTGDRVRLRADGEIEYLGRFDHQVKLRGIRIELGEIEAALTACPAVAEAAVLLRKDDGEPRLVGYLVPAIVPAAGEAAAAAEAYLRERLPAAMVPTVWVELPAFPRSPNGKVDRRGLPAPERHESAAVTAPRNPLEEHLAAIFREVLGSERIGIHDNFFDLGGHSLLAVRAAFRIAEACGIDVPVSALFAAPTVAGMAAWLAQVSPIAAAEVLEPEGDAPLSSAQQRLWFLDRLEPGSALYNLSVPLRLQGPLDVTALDRTLVEIVRRHEPLRTVYVQKEATGGDPLQVVLPSAAGPRLGIVSLAGLPAAARRESAPALLALEAAEPFDLQQGPVARFILLEWGDQESFLAVTFHHIAADGWSLGVFFRELAELYEAFVADRPSPLAPLPWRYTEIARRERRALASGALAGQLATWREQLAGLPVLDLPTDRPRPLHPSARGAIRPVELDPALVASLSRAGRGVTPFMVLLTAFTALLARISGQDDFGIGVPAAGRSRAETEGMIGLFVNTLVLRSPIAGDPPFLELMRQVRATAVAAQAMQDLPFEKLVEELAPERGSGVSPLFQVMFVFLSDPAAALRLAGLTVSRLDLAATDAKFDLSLEVHDWEGRLDGALSYRSDLFDAATVDRMAGHLSTLLAGAAAAPETRLSELPVLTAAELAQLEEWNPSRHEERRGDLSLHGLVSAQATRTPDAEAVVGGRERITYGELMQRADRVAAVLRGLGVGSEVRVGLCLRRTPDMVAAILGVLAAGGAYVPLDPAYPQERLDFMLTDSGTGLLWTEEALAGRFAFFRGRTVLAEVVSSPLGGGGLEQGGGQEGGVASSRDFLFSEALPEGGAPLLTSPLSQPPPSQGGGKRAPAQDEGRLAYLIYTSGSTGRPKGVGITHRSAVAFIEWALGVFPPEDLRGVLAATSICFDLSIFELFVPLAGGGRVILAPSVLELPQLAARDEVTLLNTVPSPMAELVRGRLPAGLRTVNLAGEALLPELVERIYAHPQVGRVINLYGPSEDTTYSTWTVVPRGAAVTIGRPIAGTQAWVLGRWGERLPAGSIGELCLGGVGLARGYLGRPELTAERFVPDPFSGEAGARLYRTGDRVRLRTDGEIEFLGRFDHQVKLRGVRIELGEIESALAGCPGGAEAAVLLRTDEGTEPRLVGYLVGEESLSATAEAYLRESLPAAMVPTAWVTLPAFPRSPGGKIDRRGLPAPERRESAGSTAPRTALEERLAGIFRGILGVERIGVHDSFFDLGGHSLLAVRLAFRLTESFGREVPVGEIFAAPTVAMLAARLVETAPDAGMRETAADVALAGGFPLSFAQQRLWLIDQLEPGSPLYNLAIPLRFAGRLNIPALGRALAEIVRRHEPLRTVYAFLPSPPIPLSHPHSLPPGEGVPPTQTPEGEREGVPPLPGGRECGWERGPGGEGLALPLQVILPASTPLPIPRVSLTALADAVRHRTAEALLREEATRPFDLRRGPVARFVLVELSEEEHLLSAVLHHIAADGWSLGIFARELAALYAAYAAGRPSPLPEPPARYAEVALRERRALASGALDGQLAYWRDQLAGIPALELPFDRPRPLQASPRGASREIDLPARLAVPAGYTSFMVLLAGFTALLGRIANQDDFGIGVPVAGRNRAATEDLIGLFVNTLVMRNRLDDDPPFGDLLRRVRGTTVAAQANQDVPFEKLVEELPPERATGVSPLFQVMFAHLGDPASLRIEGLAVSLVDLPAAEAKFDLTLSVQEGEGLSGSLNYRTDLFDAPTIDRMAGHLRTLLAGVLADPERRLSELPLMSEAERRQIEVEWTATARTVDLERCLHELFAAQAARTPELPAVVVSEGPAAGTLSYAELDARAERLAGRLRSLGVGPEVAVGLHIERSADWVIAVLGVLKAGGAWLALDPEYPAERLAAMLETSAAPVVLTQSHLAASLPVLTARVLRLDAEADWAGIPEQRAGARATAGNLACLFFTSGSTGKPKGVAVPHRGLVNRLLVTQEAYRLGPGDTALLKAAFGFDFSVWECFGPLIAGARLLVARPGGHRDAGYLVSALVEHRVTFVHFVPSMLSVFLAEEGVERCTALRGVFVGGEKLTPELRDRFFERLSAPLENEYGPTEISIDMTRWVCAPGQDPRRLPIGRPIANTRLYLLDRGLRPVPIGVTGEICVAGVGVTRGYLGRPDLTAERFLPDPLGDGGRMYRTGDLGRWLPDGTVDFLGRADQQVKVRGVRIEPAEVEAALLRHPAVAAAAVVADAMRLIAYWVARPEVPAPSPAELRDVLRASLPETMIPSLFVLLERLPLTPSGKLDRRALPAPAASTIAEERRGPAAGPVAGEKELLAELWGGLLGVERAVGPGDDFFDLGGHSLLAAQLVSRVRAVFGVELPLAAVFEASSFTGFARRVQEARRSGAGAPDQPPLVREGGTEAPLSFSQQRLWFLHQLEPDSAAYHVPGALRLRGPLDLAVLARALGAIVRRHEALRTVLADGAEGPMQVILPPAGDPPLPLADLGALPEPLREAEAQRLLAQAADRPFDLGRGPLLRAQAFRLGAGDHLLAVVMHHIVSDAWSLGVVLRELTAFYSAFSVGVETALPELAVQYPDFARWQRRWLAGEVLEREIAHWRQVLAGAPEVQELPYDRPRPAVPTGLGGRRPFALTGDELAAVRALGRREGWTLFMTLLAGFQSLLVRSSGQEDAVVGSPIANRNRLETEGLIGFFTNTLALRLDLAGDPAFREIGRRVRAAALDAYSHEDLPFEKLVEELAPERRPGLNPLFQVMLVVQRPPAAALDLPGVAVELLDVETGVAKFDLTFFLLEEAGGMTGTMEYSRDLFDAATIDRLLASFRTMLAGAVADPGLRLSRLPLLSAAEREELIAWIRPLTPRPEPRCVHEMVAAQAALHPEAEAVVSGEVRLTYRELLARARRLARRLAALGVGPDVPVGIFLERSPEMLVALLAVLEAGGAYLPLDPSYPPERLRLMLADAGAPVVLTDRAGAVPGGAGVELVVIPGAGRPNRTDRSDPTDPSDPTSAGRRPEEAPLASGVSPQNLAYVIYTSGSTGQPKGVAMTHAAISAMLAWQLRTSAAGSGRTLQFTSLSFDVSFQEIFSAWSAGGAVVLVSEEVRRDPPALLALLAAEKVERLFLPFVALQQLAVAAVSGVSGDGSPLPASLREVMSAGEQLYVTGQVAELFSRLPGSALYNHYGPSETHAVTWLALTGDPALWPERPTIGGPVDHARVFLLDRWQRPVPAGVSGEIWVGGGGLARGYQARPDLTAERFIPDPFDEIEGWQPGDRLYRTGDLARRLPDGVLEFLGRGDSQVKVRGQRIEPAEVETALARHPAVAQAAVAVRGDSAGARRLVAYLVLRDEMPAPTFAEIRAFLAETLPDPMIPSAWTRLAALPLTPSGKLDRRALAGIAPEESHRTFEPPRSPAEEIVAGIWRDVLGVQRVDLHDDFFELGGHSLLATQVASRLREAFQIELPLRRLFEAPTLEGMAAAALSAVTAGGGEAVTAAPAIRRLDVPEGTGLPLSFAQERLWFIDRLQPGPAYDLPFALRAAGDLDVSALAAALSEIVRRHEVLRTVYADRDGAAVQIVQPAAGQPLPVVDLRALTEPMRQADAARLAAAEAAWVFDLTAGPLLRTVLLALGPAEHLLLVNMHHIVSDGWSLGVLVREIKALYAAARHGEPSPLPELPVQYADFAAWQRGWMAGEVLERQLAWWREHLAGAPAALEVPADRPRPPVQSSRGADHPFALAPALARRLAGLGRDEGATLFMVLTAGLFALLARRTEQSDLVLGTPIANRNRLETERLIGFFVNNLALRADLVQVRSFHDLLHRVREASLGAYAHQDLPFEKLVDELRPERDLSRSPLFQVSVALQNAPLPAAELDGLVLAPEELPAAVAKFDLAFVFAEDAGGGLAAVLQYAADLFDATTAARLAGHLEILLGAVAAQPGAQLAELPFLSAGERQQTLLEWNDTRELVAGGALLHQLFEAQADRRPAASALAFPGEALTYGDLEAAANRLANLLREVGVGVGKAVGIWMDRSPDLVTAVLAVLKAGGTYVPLDPAWPAERAETILAATGARVVLTRAGHLAAVLEIQWRLPRLTDVICLDVQSAVPPPEPLDPESVRALWDYVSTSAVDEVTAGGFVSSFTGQPFSAEEVEEYRDRVLALAEPWLRPEARVLEIGCGSGLLLWEMARRVRFCAGLDPSPRTQERNRGHAQAAGIANVDLAVGFAHEAAAIYAGAERFDLIVLASTVQFFPGPLYLEGVVADALRLLAPGGALLIADVPDARRQGELRRALAEAGAPPRPGKAPELWLDEDLFSDLPAQVEIHHRREGFANELRFRYDVLLTPATEPAARQKRLRTGWHAAQQSAVRPSSAGFPEAIAYVIHTSGSTGVPKGIAVQHAPAVELIRWVNRTFGVGPGDRLLFVTSPAFDLSVWDMLGILGAGAALRIAAEAELRDPPALARLLREEPITIWDSAPAALQQLAPALTPGGALRLVLLSGDWIPVPLPDRVRAAFPAARVISLGGATEATVWSNWYPIGAVDPRWPSIPYGRPIANVRYHVLDGGPLPCPIGVPGDLLIGGRCLSVGYLGQPDLTAAQFIPDPFAVEPGARLYRTGDRARLGRDGNLELLGRSDQQVKVRGFRIELGEIEVALARHPAVREAVVAVREGIGGESRLVGYIVPVAGSPAPPAAELRAFLQETLPEYMVPWAFVVLAALPVTANGKFDRAALPAPEQRAASTVAPRNALEREIAAAWREVLGVDAVGVEDNFFEVGGSSLLLGKLHARLRRALDREIPFVDLFRHPTIESLARSLAEAPAAGALEEQARARTETRRERMSQLQKRRQRP